MISGFTFIHNALIGGYPIKEAIQSILPFVDELVVVDMQSNDGTRELLQSLSVRIIDGEWGNKAGKTLANAHALHNKCKGDIIIHFEADEVYDEHLICRIIDMIEQGHKNISVERIQVEQNFQKIRWYPHWVHRVFPKESVIKVGETTNQKDCEDMYYIDGKWGYLWDCTNCFRNNWFNRIKAQSELRNGEKLNTLFAPEHINLPHYLENDLKINEFLDLDLWKKKTTTLDIPDILRPLLGQLQYE